jgi:IS5 family transposase
MLRKQAPQSAPQTNLFRPLLLEFINPKNELIILGQQINWGRIEEQLAGDYTNFGAPAKPIRLMVGLLILKQRFNKSDEVIAGEWKQNPYYRFFTGSSHFEWNFPCDPTDLVYFRKRIGEEGVNVIFATRIELHHKKLMRPKK